MATKALVTKVWIDPGCIVCDACETTCPEVFEVQHDNETCIIRPEALDAEFNKPLTESIIEAAEECPVDVIKFDTVEVDAADVPAAPKPAAAPAAGAADASEPATYISLQWLQHDCLKLMLTLLTRASPLISVKSILLFT